MEKAWCRPMPQHDYVINLQNNPITTYKYRMHQEDLAKQFGVGTVNLTEQKNGLPDWVFVPTNLSSVTAYTE